MKRKHTDLIWDFKTADTKTNTHCYHNYPAMMIPQIASRLITQYGRNAKTLFDPYCGTGTSLVEANIQGINAFGTDLNPLARLIAETKTLKIKLEVIDVYLKEFTDYLLAISFGLKKTGIASPNFNNIDFWFKQETKDKLTAVKEFIDNIKNEKVKKFFLIAFSETIRESSLTKNSEFKLCRMPAKQRENFKPNVFGLMSSKLARNRSGLKSYLDKVKDTNAQATIYDFSSSDTIKKIAQESIDIIVTSPPYGDSKTTVAYGQFSRLANQWLGVTNANQIDNQLMGGKTAAINKTNIDIIDEAIETIAGTDERRAKEVYSFYADYGKSIANVAPLVKSGGHACYVIGNRRVKGIVLPTDEITKSLFSKHGFRYIDTFIRKIPNKRMPSKNSPTNIVGEKAATINNEYILVMQKLQ